jgi:hypothetical protein
MKIGRRSLSLIFCLMTTGVFAAPQTTITGELVETYCWGKMQIGGPGHAACGIACAKRGIPIAVVDAKSRKAFVLVPGRHNASIPPQLIEAIGQRVTIRGEAFARGGNQFLTVDSWRLPDSE